MARKRNPATIELSIGPHQARANWSVLRVNYLNSPENSTRISAAIELLLAPPPEPADPQPPCPE